MTYFSNLTKRLATSLLDIILFILQVPVFNAIVRCLLRVFNPRNDVLMTLHEHKVYVNTIDRMMAVMFWKFSSSEDCEHHFIKDFVRQGMRVVDIGANVGYHTLQLAQCVGESGRVYAFEPDPGNYRLLRKNIEVNQYQNVITTQKAISDKAGAVELFICEENRGDNRIFNSNDGRKSVEIEAVALDQFFKDSQENIDLIKIDTQGAECLVLSGMKDLVARNDQLVIICEFVPFLLVKCGFSAGELLSQIRDLGFNIYLIDEKSYQVESVEDERLIKQYAGGKRYTNLLLKKN